MSVGAVIDLRDHVPGVTSRIVRREVVAERGDRRVFVGATIAATVTMASIASARVRAAPVTYDEAAVATLARQRLGTLLGIAWHRQLNGVAYDVLLKAWTGVAGYGAGALRTPTVVLTVALVPLTAVLARELFGCRAAALAGFALVADASVVTGADTSSGRPMATVAVVMAALWCLRAASCGRRRWWAAAAGAATVAVWSDFFGGLVVLAVLLSVLLTSPTGRIRRATIAVGAAVVILSAPVALYLLSGRSAGSDWRSAASGQGHLLQRSLRYLSGGSPTWLGPLLVAAVVVASLSWWRLRVLARPRAPGALGLPLAVAWVAVPTAIALAVSFVVPVLAPAYLFVAEPGVALVVVAVMAVVPGGRIRTVCVFAVLALQASTALSPAPPSREGWARLVAVLRTVTRPGDVVVVDPSYEQTTLAYYLRAGAGVRLEPGVATGEVLFGTGGAPPARHGAVRWLVTVDDVPGTGPRVGRPGEVFGELRLQRLGAADPVGPPRRTSPGSTVGSPRSAAPGSAAGAIRTLCFGADGTAIDCRAAAPPTP